MCIMRHLLLARISISNKSLQKTYGRIVHICKMSGGKYGFGSDPVPYTPPEWADNLDNHPKHKIQLGHLDTPIHKWKLPGFSEDFQLYIKRDDMTGSTLSGNKIRKLEFLLADAVSRGCKHVITCGVIHSNHCRATAVAAVQLGLKPHLVLRTDSNNVEEAGCKGNLFLDRICGSDIYLIPKIAPYETELKPRMELLAKKIKKETGEDSYLVPVGGSNPIGFYGYLNAFHELQKQGVLEDFDDIVFACGSGGTADGLSIGNYLTGSALKIHAIAVSDGASYFHSHVNSTLKAVGLADVRSEDILDVIEGYKGRGYGINTQEELDFILEVARTSGIMLDPVYTGKAAKGLVQEVKVNPTRFKGKRILFIHTGGVFGMYDGRIDDLVTSSTSSNIHMWPDKATLPVS